jgi:4-amino-4-deoxy-L-arabinose transferase-like glycosyltransferase
MVQRRTLWMFLALFSALLFIERPASWLGDPDEARYAEIPQRMLATGDYVTPRLNGSDYFEKPPLLYWANALSMKWFGDSPYAARLPTRCATIGVVLLLLLLLKKTPADAPLWAALIFMSSTLPFVLGRINLTDAMVSLGLTLTLLSMRNFLIDRNGNRTAIKSSLGIGAGLAIGVLSKGVIGVFLPGVILLLWCAVTREWKRIGEMIFSWATPLFVVLSVPWFALMEMRHPGFSEFYFIHEHVMRFATDSAHREGPLYYFIPIFIVGFLPWTPMLIPAGRTFFRRPFDRFRGRRDELFFGLWLAVIVGFFSTSHSKLIPYILPAFPAAAVLVALVMPQHPSRTRLLRMAVWAVLYAAAIIKQPAICELRSMHALAIDAQRVNADRVVAYRTFPHSFPLVLKHPIPVVEYQGELASDNIKDPALFWTEEKFWAVWNSSQNVVAVLSKNENQLRFTAQPRTSHVLAQNKHDVLIANFDPLNKRR